MAARVLAWCNRLALALAMLAVLAACGVLSASVVLRYFLKVPTDWQDEVAVFLLVGATFFSAAHVQARRGHIGIEIAATLLPPALDRLRRALCDVLALLFCAFFTWKSWTLWLEAWSEGQTTSSEWAPPLALPYGLMSAGMTLLTLQLLLQCLIAWRVGARHGVRLVAAGGQS
ncbi:MAG: TRAP transporter small permease [Pseudomonadota bacterium]|nr:TRAP transporter small permease [Pseudomonadota bacterium]